MADWQFTKELLQMANKNLKSVFICTKNIWSANELRYHFSFFKFIVIKKMTTHKSHEEVSKWVLLHKRGVTETKQYFQENHLAICNQLQSYVTGNVSSRTNKPIISHWIMSFHFGLVKVEKKICGSALNQQTTFNCRLDLKLLFYLYSSEFWFYLLFPFFCASQLECHELSVKRGRI